MLCQIRWKSLTFDDLKSQARQEPQWGPGKHSRGARNIFTVPLLAKLF